MSKVKDFYKKYREVIVYLLFGLVTMAVSFSIFYASLFVATNFFDALRDGKTGTRYIVANGTANVLKWCSGVLVAFYTNRKWVFTDADKSKHVGKQLLLFAEGRVLTLIMAMILQYLLELLFSVVITRDITLLGVTFTAEIIGTTVALIIYSLIEVVANYFFSKKFVFTKKQYK